MKSRYCCYITEAPPHDNKLVGAIEIRGKHWIRETISDITRMGGCAVMGKLIDHHWCEEGTGRILGPATRRKDLSTYERRLKKRS